ncbi:MAG: BPSS1780 family membrane protein [Betaproteobacteria bacterium]
MKVQILPARQGWRWLLDGLRIFRKFQFMFPIIVLSYWMLMVILNSVPVIGPVVATVFIPAFSVSLMNICRTIEQGEPINPALLISGFRANLRTLLILGVIYLILALAILGLTSLIDDGVLLNFFVAGKNHSGPNASEADTMLSAQVALMLFAPLMMAYWYAPVLAAWHGLSPAKSLFFSFVACLRNWRAFLVYSLAVFIVGLLLPGLVLNVLSSFFFGQSNPVLVLLTLMVIFIGMPVLYASFYVSYRDVFVTIDEDA